MGVKQPSGAGKSKSKGKSSRKSAASSGGARKSEQLAENKRRAGTAKRRARLAMGTPPAAKLIVSKKDKPEKHKR